MGVTFFPWRSWLLMAPFAALVAADGLLRLVELSRPWRYVAVVVCLAPGSAALLFDVSSGLAGSQWLRPSWLVVVVACFWLIVSVARGMDPHRRWVVVLLMACHLAVAWPVRAAGLLDPGPPRVF